MSNILVNISTVPGESQQAGYTGQIECFAMNHAIDLPTVTMGASRTGGASRHGAIHLLHSVDKATPGLRHACSAGTNLGTVVISTMQMIEGTSKAVDVHTLSNAYVVRMEMETPVDPSTNKPAEEPVETFALEYSAITWDRNRYENGALAGTTSGAWDPSETVTT